MQAEGAIHMDRVSDLYVHHPLPFEHVQDITFHEEVNEDGTRRVTADMWPGLILVSHELLDAVDVDTYDSTRSYITASRDWSILTIHPDNGVAFYRAEARYPERDMTMYRLVWGELEE